MGFNSGFKGLTLSVAIPYHQCHRNGRKIGETETHKEVHCDVRYLRFLYVNLYVAAVSHHLYRMLFSFPQPTKCTQHTQQCSHLSPPLTYFGTSVPNSGSFYTKFLELAKIVKLGERTSWSGTVVPKHDGVIQDNTTAYIIRAFSGFGKRKQVDWNVGTKQIQNIQKVFGILRLTN